MQNGPFEQKWILIRYQQQNLELGSMFDYLCRNWFMWVPLDPTPLTVDEKEIDLTLVHPGISNYKPPSHPILVILLLEILQRMLDDMFLDGELN